MINLKVKLVDDIRKARVPSAQLDTLSALEAFVHGTFGIESQLLLKYRDAEGDLITLASDADVQLAKMEETMLYIHAFATGEPNRPEPSPSVVSQPPDESFTSVPLAVPSSPSKQQPSVVSSLAQFTPPPPMQNGFPQPNANQGYGLPSTQQQQQSSLAPPPSMQNGSVQATGPQGYGLPPAQHQQSSVKVTPPPPMQNGFGQTNANQGYGLPPTQQQQSLGQFAPPSMQNSLGQSNANQGYGLPPTQQQQQRLGAPPTPIGTPLNLGGPPAANFVPGVANPFARPPTQSRPGTYGNY